MAQQDATEQIKEVLRQVIKYRFWIAVTSAALFAVIAYFMGSGPVKAKTVTETNNINSAESAVKKFASTAVPTAAYKPIVEEKTEIVSKDVTKAWKELYDRQAPLLTWPETVQARFRKWGRKWPEDEDSARVQLAFVDYTYAYPAYVDMVYKTFNPFDYETGEGIVAAPPKEALLRPVTFSVEDKPDLGKVWAAQERLWIQHTVLEVILQVNKHANAKNWDSAIVKEINVLEVGNPMAQDQRSLANAEELKKADEILAPGQTAAETEAAAPAMGAMGGARGAESMMMGGMGRGAMMGGSGGMGGPAGGGAKYDDAIYYINPANDKQQYKILPILVTVLIDQDHVQDFLVELENSPMSIQVMDFEMARPTSRVTKPEKGNPMAGGGMMGMMGGMNGMMRSMMGRGQSAYGGMMMGRMNEQMMSRMGQMSGNMGNMGNMMGNMMGGMNTAKPERKGTDIRSKDSKAEREKTTKEAEERKGPALFDAYFNIVEVTVYGRARFFLAPPAEAAPEPSLGDTPAAATTPTGSGNAAAPQETPGASKPAGAPVTGADASKKPADVPAAGDAAAKADAEKPAAKADAEKPAAKADAEKPAAKADAEKPAAKAGQPDGKGAVPKS